MAKIYTRGGHVILVHRSREGVTEDLRNGAPLPVTFRMAYKEFETLRKSRKSIDIDPAAVVAVEGD